jgi:nucleoside-diphosphate-sugar epimerase
LNARATVLTRSFADFALKAPHIASDPSITFVDGDVRNFVFPDGEFRFVIHAATEASAHQALHSPSEMLTTIVDGTQRTLAFAKTHGTKRLLLTSSGAVYGKQPSTVTHLPESYQGEPDPTHPGSVYGEGKRRAEYMCAVACEEANLECVLARCWAFCGPHLPLDKHFAIGNFIGDVLAQRTITIEGDGTARRSYLYGVDLAIWLWTLLFRGPSLVPINVGSADDVSILELAQTVASVLDPASRIDVKARPLPGASPSRYVPDVSLAARLLGLHETVPLRETIRRTADWHRSHN